ncbi:MAG: ATP-binding cassette domain-containing protein [Pseudomonadota bacterium]|jgi:lipoprotein-releasing system ATP-binding protein|nr:ATP-binding cassette domain-containing protein [Pseudomonadota bacterium]
MNKSAETVVRCHELVKNFEQGETSVEVLSSVNLDVAVGESVAVVGASGSGKSTLLHLLAGLDDPTAGLVEVNGVNPAAIGQRARGDLRNKVLGFIYQFHHLLGDFTAEENVAMPLLIRNHPVADAMLRARRLLERVGLENRFRHRPAQLSGGERQRAAVARALVTHPACVLADEPTGNLDRRSATAVQSLLIELNHEYGISLVVATHDPDLAHRLQRSVRLVDGRLIA